MGSRRRLLCLLRVRVEIPLRPAGVATRRHAARGTWPLLQIARHKIFHRDFWLDTRGTGERYIGRGLCDYQALETSEFYLILAILAICLNICTQVEPVGGTGGGARWCPA